MQDNDFKWFIENYDAIYAKHGRAYVVIKNKVVLGAYATPAQAIAETSKHEEAGTYIVQLCNGNETGYTNYIASFNFMNA